MCGVQCSTELPCIHNNMYVVSYYDHSFIMCLDCPCVCAYVCMLQVKDGAEMATVLANKEGIIFHVMDGEQTPEEVREILAKK